MPSRRFRSPLVAAVLVGSAGLAVPVADGASAAAAPVVAAAPGAATTEDTANPFLPDDRAISDCVSAVPKPGCGSKARGGWHQYLVAIALLGGLTVIGWRIVSGVRRTPSQPPTHP